MLAQEVAKKYASALFLAVEDKNLIDRSYEDFNNLKKTIDSDNTLLNFLAAPQVLDEHKMAVVRDVFSPRMEQLFVEFLLVLVDKNRINFLPEILDEFNRLVEARQGIGRITVISAVKLDDSEKEKLKVEMAQKTKLKIILEEKVDKSIIGGMIVILHNEIIDNSVKHNLALLEEQLSKVRVH